MKEIGKFCRIYCSETNKKWPELLPYIERWLNETSSDSTGYSPVELMSDADKADLFERILKREPECKPPVQGLQEKIIQAYMRMKERAAKRNKKKKGVKWNPKVGELVLAKCQPVSDAVEGITKKFSKIYDGPWKVTRMVTSSTYEVTDANEKILKVFNKGALKPYLTAEEELSPKV